MLTISQMMNQYTSETQQTPLHATGYLCCFLRSAAWYPPLSLKENIVRLRRGHCITKQRRDVKLDGRPDRVNDRGSQGGLIRMCGCRSRPRRIQKALIQRQARKLMLVGIVQHDLEVFSQKSTGSLLPEMSSSRWRSD